MPIGARNPAQFWTLVPAGFHVGFPHSFP